MPQSDSDDFESADEGHVSTGKKDRKKRNSSSNYSDNLELDSPTSKTKPPDASKNLATDGWDDFEIEDNETVEICEEPKVSRTNNEPKPKQESSQDTGWDDFDDWGQSDSISTEPPKQQKPDHNIQTITDRLANTTTKSASSDIQGVTDKLATSTTMSASPDIQGADKLAAAPTKSDSWGWGWGVDTLLSTATAGISNITSQVSQGISTVLETGIGAPDPEELARKTAKSSEVPATEQSKAEAKSEDVPNDSAFQFGSLLSGVTKFVETTGTKVIAGGLDTLETIGKKTMEVLQDGDPGLAKKRALLGLDNDKPVLSQILREAKEKAEEEDKIREAKREAKEVHYESLFDDFEGLVHLEALEMLSRQVNMRIEERLRSAEPDKRQDIKETLQQIAELCEMPEDDDDDDADDEEHPPDMSKEDIFHEKLQRATRDIGLKMQFQPLIKQYTDTLAGFATPGAHPRAVYKRAVSCLACGTALCVQLYHKTCEMLLVKPRRSTADEADALAQLTVVLTKHISEMATSFTEKLTQLPDEEKDVINNYITNIFLEAGNSSKYIENAFQLTLPIIQIGAV
ncbi:protein FAM114A2 [Colias croceus]|uniref:protein FAM114A2 n=1 Tax=Colias crocea TaxID=72248 RepID=UPI001E27B304|nr:protein FAM114A2 [Colias croceus]